MSLKKNVIANFFGQGWGALMAVAFIPIYIRHLGIEAYGLIGVFTLMQAWLGVFDFGMTPTINREMARFKAGNYTLIGIKNLLRSLEIISLTIGVLLVLLIWMVSEWLASDWLKVEKIPIQDVVLSIILMGAVIGVRFLEGLYRAAIMGLQEQVWLNIVSSISATVRWVGGVIVVIEVSADIISFFLWQGLVSLITVIAFLITLYKFLPETDALPRFCFESIRSVWGFARGMLLTTFLVLVLTQIDKVLLSRLIGLNEFGYYTLAVTVSFGLLQLASPLSQALFPKMTELVQIGDTTNLIATYHKGTQITNSIIVPMGLAMSIYAQEILMLWTSDYELSSRSSHLLSVLTIGTLFNAIMQIPYMLQLAYGWTQLAIKMNIGAIIFLIPVLFVCVPKYGVEAAAWIWLVLNLSYVVLGIHIMHKKLLRKEKWAWYLDDLLAPSFGAFFVVYLSRYFFYAGFSNLSQLVWIVFTVIFASCVAFFITKLAFKNW